MANTALTREQALALWTELQRRVQVGAYLELQHDGSYPEDDGSPESSTLESIDNLEQWAGRQGLEFCWHQESNSWSLETYTPRPGECAECGRYASALSSTGLCEGCVMQAAIDAHERY